MQNYRGKNHKEWADAGLDTIQDKHEMKYVNQEEDGCDTYRGEWFIADDETRTIIYGTFGNYNSPGASHYTYAEVYDADEESEYREEVAKWESMPEYVESDDPDDEDEEDKDDCEDDEEDSEEESGEPEEGDYTTTDHRHFYQYGKLVVTVPMADDFMWEDWKPHVHARMKKNNFFPGVWFVSDHGNAHPLSVHVDNDGKGEDQKEEPNQGHHHYEVVVGNIGSVYSGHDTDNARGLYQCYVNGSKSGQGREAGEPVTFFVDGEIADQYVPPGKDDQTTDLEFIPGW